jgi:membrane fusion protein, multidrug efflux system
MKKKLLTSTAGIIVLLFSIIFSIGLIRSKPVPHRDEKREQLLNVKTKLVISEKITTNFSYQGRVNALENISLAAEVNGKIMQGEIPFKEGQNFSNGDLLFKIYNKDAEANLKASKSKFLRTLSIILADLNVDYPESFQTWKVFFNSIKLDAPLPKLPAVKSEKEKIFLAANNVLSEYYSLNQQEIAFSKYNIYAPFDGYFKKVNRQVGSIAANGSELAVIVRSDVLEIVVPVLPDDATRIVNNQKVQIENKSAKKCSGMILRIAQFVDESTQSVNVYISYKPNTQYALLEGEFVTVKFKNKDMVNGIKIPREALLENQFVYLVQDNKLLKTKVKIIQTLEDFTVVNGLEQGSIIVIESLIDAREGLPVLPIM